MSRNLRELLLLAAQQRRAPVARRAPCPRLHDRAPGRSIRVESGVELGVESGVGFGFAPREEPGEDLDVPEFIPRG